MHPFGEPRTYVLTFVRDERQKGPHDILSGWAYIWSSGGSEPTKPGFIPFDKVFFAAVPWVVCFQEGNADHENDNKIFQPRFSARVARGAG